MWYSTAGDIQSLVVNRCILLVQVLTISLVTSSAYFSFKVKQTVNVVDKTNMCEDPINVIEQITNRACATGAHNWSGCQGSLPLCPPFHTLIYGGRSLDSRSYGSS
jgi:hypothetical protein